MRSRFFAILITFTCLFMIASHADATTVLASNIPTGFTFTDFRGDVGYQAGQFTNTADGQLFVAQTSGTVESITSYINDQMPGQTVPLQVGIYAASGTLPGSLIGNLV
jgi:hypothetical protein